MGIYIMTRYKNDPYPLTLKYAGSCAACGCSLGKGSRAYYWPSSREIYCIPCGDQDYRRFLECAQDEDFFCKR